MTIVAADSLERWQAIRRTTTRERFVDQFRHPFLVRSTKARPAPTADAGDWTEKVSFETLVQSDPEPVVRAPSGRLHDARIHAVVKAPQNPFPDRISVGRALNCDIVLRDSSVSKLHAHLHPLSPCLAEVVDTGSANGTRVNGKPLTPAHPQQVSSGDTLIFGGVAVQFVDPGKLYDLL